MKSTQQNLDNVTQDQLMKEVEKLIDKKLLPLWEEQQYHHYESETRNMAIVDSIIDFRDCLSRNFPGFTLDSDALCHLHAHYEPQVDEIEKQVKRLRLTVIDGGKDNG